MDDDVIAEVSLTGVTPALSIRPTPPVTSDPSSLDLLVPPGPPSGLSPLSSSVVVAPSACCLLCADSTGTRTHATLLCAVGTKHLEGHEQRAANHLIRSITGHHSNKPSPVRPPLLAEHVDL
ncbi:hypothetical protein EYF80_056712 [Liparis tanakae]|uniref:Uncharacterized protein n=1 Tax=Liparis tanakae TaxID=230148 RepID=A0A4Z2EY03_9TELE|nr:hypothetical protein EYF80_056712 [Liparis tanakae]